MTLQITFKVHVDGKCTVREIEDYCRHLEESAMLDEQKGNLQLHSAFASAKISVARLVV